MSLPAPEAVGLARGTISFVRQGLEGAPTAILLHGGGLDRALLSWRSLFPHLARTRPVVAPDWPGHGESTPFGRPFTVADLGQALISFMDALEIERADLVGVSMGGGAALWTAIHHPDRVRRLVPAATYGVQARAPLHRASFVLTRTPLTRASHLVLRASAGATRAALRAIFAHPERVTDALVEEVRDALRSGETGRAFADFQRGEMTRTGLMTVLTPHLARVSHRTLFVHGAGDRLVPLACVRRAAEAMPDADLRVLDAGHWPMRERADEFDALVEAFLD